MHSLLHCGRDEVVHHLIKVVIVSCRVVLNGTALQKEEDEQ